MFTDLYWALGLNQFALELMGIWPNDEEDVAQSLSTIARIPIMILVAFFGFVLPQMSAIPLIVMELPLLIESCITCCAGFWGCVKLFFIWNSKEVLRPVTKSIIRDWLRPKKSWQLEIMKSDAKWARIITIIDYITIAFCYAGFAIAPMLGIQVRTISNITDYSDRRLPFRSRYPYDYSLSPQFEITHFFQLLGCFFAGLAISIPDDYFGVLVFHASAQFQILGVNIENFVEEIENGTKVSLSENYYKKMGSLINRHVHLTRTVSAVERSFSFVMAVQLLSMISIVCCLGFHILSLIGGGKKPTTLQMLVLGGSLFTIMLHTLVNCFGSEILATRRSNLFFNIYNRKWYLQSADKMRIILPMMIISKNAETIKAGKIVYLSLDTYCKIIKSTFGYISMLIAVSKKNQLK